MVFWFASFPIATKAEYVVLQMRADLTAAHQARFCGREIASTRQQLGSIDFYIGLVEVIYGPIHRRKITTGGLALASWPLRRLN